MKMRKVEIAAVALSVALSSGLAAADVPDLTAQMEYLCNPNASRWTASQPLARAATSLGVCDGKLFVSGGDWDDNLGPCPIFSVDPYTGAYVKEFESGTESIDYFRTDSEGCLYAPSVDPREGHVNECNVARRNVDGTWTALKIAPNRWISDAYYGTHTWDVAFWKDRIFTAGYGIGAGPEKTTARLSDATPQIASLYRVYASQFGGTFQRYRRFYAFLPFEDDLFCYPLVYSGVGNNAYSKIGSYDYEEWRYDEATGTFACTTNAFSNVTPGLSRSDLAFVSDSSMDVQLWHPTAFNGRVLYIAGMAEMTISGVTGMTTVPFALYTAQNVNHSVRATRVDLGSGVFPFDIFVHDGVATVLAAQYDSTAKKAVNSVWESTDGVTFTKKFTFSGVQHACAIAYCDGAYFVAMGAREAVKNAWTFTGTDEVGNIYRIRDPAYADAIQVVAENEEVSVPEGGTAVARFKLAAQPAASVTAAVRVSGGVPAVSTDVASVTFTTQDWNQWHEVSLAAEEDNLDSEIPSMLVCGAGDPAALRAASVTVTPVNNDFFVPLTTADSGAVATNSATHAQYGANGAFDDNRSDTNGRWLSTKSDHMFVVWKFNAATAVDMLRIWNGSDTAGGYASASRAPKAWTFSGSNDGETWTTLDTRTGETGWSSSGESRLYSFTNDTAYLYYKFDCTALNGATDYLQIWELEFYYVDGGSSGGDGSVGGDQPGGGDEPEPSGGDGRGFARKTTFAPSASARAKIGDSSWTNFPVLLRLPESVSSQFRSANGTDMLVEDENGAELLFEVETFNPEGTTFVWVKVPALSSATVLTVYFGGAANTNNDPTAVWSRYAGVWHFAPSAAGTMTVPDATGNGLHGATTNTLAAYEGPAGLGALQAGSVIRAPDYDVKLDSAAQFSASGWFKAPTQESSWWMVASKKVGITTGPNGENLWNVDKGWYIELPQSKIKLNLIYSTSAQMSVPDVSANWNYFQVVSDGSTLKVYLNGSSSPAKSISYTVKASGTPYQMCMGNGCSRECRVRIGAASAAETALEYATMADEAFFAMGEIETVGVFVPAPVFGGEGVPAPAFGVDQSSGNPVFTFAIGNAVKGVRYQVYRAASLTEQFEPWGEVITAGAAGVLDFAVATEDAPSGFFKVVPAR